MPPIEEQSLVQAPHAEACDLLAVALLPRGSRCHGTRRHDRSTLRCRLYRHRHGVCGQDGRIRQVHSRCEVQPTARFRTRQLLIKLLSQGIEYERHAGQARALAEEPAGQVMLASRNGQAEGVPVPALSTGRPERVGCRDVLYIEDNEVNVMIVAEMVGCRGDLRFHSAADGLKGVELARALLPALVLVDMQLPDIDGLEVLRRLRADPRTADLRCVALSANAMPADIQVALRAGFAAYMTKPLDFAGFMAELESHFGPAPA